MVENNVETESKVERTRGQALIGMMKGLVEDIKTTASSLKENPVVSGAVKDQLRVEGRMAILAGLIAVELLPVGEDVNDVTKTVSMAEKLKKLAKDKVPGAVKGASKAGVIGDLYPNIPEWLLAPLTAVDIAGVPAVGILPEAIQILYDGVVTSNKNKITVARESINTFRGIRNQRKAQIASAQAAFNS